jgi:hypothetical protein
MVFSEELVELNLAPLGAVCCLRMEVELSVACAVAFSMLLLYFHKEAHCQLTPSN